MIDSEEAGESEVERELADRSSDEALITDLFEALKDHLPGIQEKKTAFKQQIAESVSKSRIIGKGGTDDMILVLRDWNSFSPILRRELRDQGGPGPDERYGGGYFLMWKGHGIVIDPGVDFVTQLYRKGLSIADVDTVIVTHCHLDHTRDVESLVDLNYRYNRAKGFSPHSTITDFRQLRFYLCDPAFIKYSEYLKNSGCCRNPMQLERGGGARQLTEFIDILAIPAQHKDINGRDDEAIGLVFVLKEENGPVVRVGITSDSKWNESLPESFSGCDVLVAHLGTIEIEEKKAARGRQTEHAADPGKDADTGEFLKTDLKNHLGTKGCFRLLQSVKPKIFIIGEFGEELVETRFNILQVFHRLKPNDTRFVLGGDSNLAIGLGKELSVCCSHPECARSWSRIPLNQVRPVLGGDFLFQYICPQHGIIGPRTS
ncbi:MAG: MBL fold metallo-hydrolase [Deltaproteobacteria bacterium]|nr:MBL fold metallo-hydrolase [Deltaproteobacteria bacterium]